ncbi:MAG: choline ABC transporter substrate-binding protein [Labrys sp. (in: a-proteobacteria)]
MRRIGVAFAIAALVMGASGKPAMAGEPEACRTVRFSDVGWTDITSTTAIASHVLQGLGYTPKTTVLSISVTYASMKNKDIDVYLGDWQPSMVNERKPYLDDKSIVVSGANLPVGAKYTLAVPQYTYDKGLKDFADIAKFRDSLQEKIYGIEPGDTGNNLIHGLIDGDKHGLKGFQLVESSEQGMLAQVQGAVARGEDIVFLGWAPHPMNVNFKIQYLTGGDDTFGPNFGSAVVYTDIRAGWDGECPNAAKFIGNLKFNVDLENQVMNTILTEGKEGAAVAAEYLKANPGVLDAWLDGVTTFDGQPGLPAVKKSLGL